MHTNKWHISNDSLFKLTTLITDISHMYFYTFLCLRTNCVIFCSSPIFASFLLLLFVFIMWLSLAERYFYNLRANQVKDFSFHAIWFILHEISSMKLFLAILLCLKCVFLGGICGTVTVNCNEVILRFDDWKWVWIDFVKWLWYRKIIYRMK